MFVLETEIWENVCTPSRQLSNVFLELEVPCCYGIITEPCVTKNLKTICISKELECPAICQFKPIRCSRKEFDGKKSLHKSDNWVTIKLRELIKFKLRELILFCVFFCYMDIKRLASLLPFILPYGSSHGCGNVIDSSIIVSFYCFYVVATNANAYFHNFGDGDAKYCLYFGNIKYLNPYTDNLGLFHTISAFKTIHWVC